MSVNTREIIAGLILLRDSNARRGAFAQGEARRYERDATDAGQASLLIDSLIAQMRRVGASPAALDDVS